MALFSSEATMVPLPLANSCFQKSLRAGRMQPCLLSSIPQCLEFSVSTMLPYGWNDLLCQHSALPDSPVLSSDPLTLCWRSPLLLFYIYLFIGRGMRVPWYPHGCWRTT